MAQQSTASVSAMPAPRRRRLVAVLSRLGVETAEEAEHCMALASQAFLANSVFVFGRNVGPVIFMQQCGAEALTSALVVSGLSVMVVSPAYASMSAGKLAAHVNLVLSLFSAACLSVLAAPLIIQNVVHHTEHPPNWMERVAAMAQDASRPAAYLIYQMQDTLTLLLMMQSASLSQATLNSYTAKRLLGLVQLGCSTGAIATGLVAGVLAKTIGPAAMILVQVRPHHTRARALTLIRSRTPALTCAVTLALTLAPILAPTPALLAGAPDLARARAEHGHLAGRGEDAQQRREA